MTAAFLFWLGIVLMLHSYAVYPLLLQVLASGKKDSEPPAQADEAKPHVAVICSVYNAERLIRAKIESIFGSTYPPEKLHVWIGSDASDDATNTYLQQLAAQYPNLRLVLSSERRGKIKMMNDLAERVQQAGLPDDTILLSTDVSAIFHPQCISRLVRHFQQPDIGLVGAHLIKGQVREDGISQQEKLYYERELRMKHREGLLWGAVMGVFGACFAMRCRDFTPVPSNFLVDDFYTTFTVIRSGKRVIQDTHAVVYMDVPNESATEFGRKVRISAGNFQNLQRFWPMLLRFNGIAFAFWSHKFIRWIGPFLILLCALMTLVLLPVHPLYRLAFAGQTLLFLTPLLNYLLERAHVHLKMLKFVAHFYLMNLGILAGFIQFIKGIKNNVWTPTQR